MFSVLRPSSPKEMSSSYVLNPSAKGTSSIVRNLSDHPRKHGSKQNLLSWCPRTLIKAFVPPASVSTPQSPLRPSLLHNQPTTSAKLPIHFDNPLKQTSFYLLLYISIYTVAYSSTPHLNGLMGKRSNSTSPYLTLTTFAV